MASTSREATLPGPIVAERPASGGFARREQLWGYLFISPWIVGFLLFTLLPMAAALVFSFTDFDLRRPDEIRFIGLRNYERLIADPDVAHSLAITVRFILITVPLNLAFSLGAGGPAQLAAAGRQEPPPDAVLHADPDPARRRDAHLAGRPERVDRLGQPAPRDGRRAGTGLDRRLVVGPRRARPDRDLGRRQHDADLHRRPAGRPDRAVRRGAGRRRRDLDDVPAGHAAADHADPLLQPPDQPRHELPGVHPAVGPQERDPGRLDQPVQRQPLSRGLRVQPDGLRVGARLGPVRCHPGRDRRSCSARPAAGSTTRPSADDRDCRARAGQGHRLASWRARCGGSAAGRR